MPYIRRKKVPSLKKLLYLMPMRQAWLHITYYILFYQFPPHTAKCGKRVHPSNIWRNDYDPEYNGCFRSLKNYFIEQLFIIGIACFASGLAQVVCIFLSGWLYRLIVEFRYI